MIVRLATTMDKLAARLTIIAVSRADHFIEKRKIVKNHPRGILPSPSSRQTEDAPPRAFPPISLRMRTYPPPPSQPHATDRVSAT